MIILGIEIKSGEYEGRAYNNLMIYCQSDEIATNQKRFACGHKIETLKIKNTTDDFKRVFGKPGMSEKELNEMLGRECFAYYDRWKNVQKLEFVS